MAAVDGLQGWQDFTSSLRDNVSKSSTQSSGDIDSVTALDVSAGKFDDMLDYYTKLASQGDEVALDRLWNYYASERSNKTARDWSAAREDTAYQRLIKDLEKAGIAPYVISSASPNVSASTGNAYSGSYALSKYKTDEDNKVKLITAILRVLGSVAGSIFSSK